MKILKFYTDTCSQCKHQNTILEGFTGAEIVPVDCETEFALTDKYSIMAIPTMIVLDDEDNVVKRFTGVTPIEDIVECLK